MRNIETGSLGSFRRKKTNKNEEDAESIKTAPAPIPLKRANRSTKRLPYHRSGSSSNNNSSRRGFSAKLPMPLLDDENDSVMSFSLKDKVIRKPSLPQHAKNGDTVSLEDAFFSNKKKTTARHNLLTDDSTIASAPSLPRPPAGKPRREQRHLIFPPRLEPPPEMRTVNGTRNFSNDRGRELDLYLPKSSSRPKSRATPERHEPNSSSTMVAGEATSWRLDHEEKKEHDVEKVPHHMSTINSDASRRDYSDSTSRKITIPPVESELSTTSSDRGKRFRIPSSTAKEQREESPHGNNSSSAIPETQENLSVPLKRTPSSMTTSSTETPLISNTGKDQKMSWFPPAISMASTNDNTQLSKIMDDEDKEENTLSRAQLEKVISSLTYSGLDTPLISGLMRNYIIGNFSSATDAAQPPDYESVTSENNPENNKLAPIIERTSSNVTTSSMETPLTSNLMEEDPSESSLESQSFESEATSIISNNILPYLERTASNITTSSMDTPLISNLMRDRTLTDPPQMDDITTCESSVGSQSFESEITHSGNMLPNLERSMSGSTTCSMETPIISNSPQRNHLKKVPSNITTTSSVDTQCSKSVDTQCSKESEVSSRMGGSADSSVERVQPLKSTCSVSSSASSVSSMASDQSSITSGRKGRRLRMPSIGRRGIGRTSKRLPLKDSRTRTTLLIINEEDSESDNGESESRDDKNEASDAATTSSMTTEHDGSGVIENLSTISKLSFRRPPDNNIHNSMPSDLTSIDESSCNSSVATAFSSMSGKSRKFYMPSLKLGLSSRSSGAASENDRMILSSLSTTSSMATEKRSNRKSNRM